MPTPTPVVTVTPTVAPTLTFPTPSPGFIAVVVVVVVLAVLAYGITELRKSQRKQRIEANARQLIYTYKSHHAFEGDAQRLEYQGFDVVSANTVHHDEEERITVVYRRAS